MAMLNYQRVTHENLGMQPLNLGLSHEKIMSIHPELGFSQRGYHKQVSKLGHKHEAKV